MWLIGHSDGASIAPLYAARFIDADLSIESIKQAKAAYERGDLRARLARYHADVDTKFYGWNDIWLDPAFRAWSMVGELATIRAPPLAAQAQLWDPTPLLHRPIDARRIAVLPFARAVCRNVTSPPWPRHIRTSQ